MSSYPLGKHDGRNEFWQINIGHVLQMISMLSALGFFAANMVSSFSSQATLLNDLRSTVGDMREWRVQTEQQNFAWHQEIKDSFDEINRHLGKLDAQIGANPALQAPYARRGK